MSMLARTARIADCDQSLAQQRTNSKKPWATVDLGRRLLRDGAKAMSDGELLEALTEARIEPSHLKELAQADPIILVGRLGETGAARLLASLELGRRLLRAHETRPQLGSPLAIYEYLASDLLALRNEVFHVLALNARNVLLANVRVGTGSASSCPVDPREVFSVAIANRAAAIILAHNHPSGDPQPSGLDIALTRQLAEGGKLLHVRVLDHVIVGDGRFASFQELGLLPGLLGAAP